MSNAVRWSPEQLVAYRKRRGVLATATGPALAVARKVGVDQRMNKLETRYAGEVLEPMKRADEIADYGFERIRLRLANQTWYWPDFDLVRLDGGIEVRECKGFMREDAWIKLKICAAMYPHIRIVVVRWKKGWISQEVAA